MAPCKVSLVSYTLHTATTWRRVSGRRQKEQSEVLLQTNDQRLNVRRNVVVRKNGWYKIMVSFAESVFRSSSVTTKERCLCELCWRRGLSSQCVLKCRIRWKWNRFEFGVLRNHFFSKILNLSARCEYFQRNRLESDRP